MSDDQVIRVGQIWRRKRNGRLIRIVRRWDPLLQEADDWVWEGHDYKGRGASYGEYIRRGCELAKDAD